MTLTVRALPLLVLLAVVAIATGAAGAAKSAGRTGAVLDAVVAGGTAYAWVLDGKTQRLEIVDLATGRVLRRLEGISLTLVPAS